WRLFVGGHTIPGGTYQGDAIDPAKPFALSFRNIQTGEIRFALDAEEGSVMSGGTIQAVTLVGSTLKTALTERRIEIGDVFSPVSDKFIYFDSSNRVAARIGKN